MVEVGGENAIAVLRSFKGKHSDEDFVKKLKIKISDVRSTLNRLHSEGLVVYERKKDSETGWYSYTWQINLEKIKRWAEEIKKEEREEEEGQDQYYCPVCGISSIVSFERAMENGFKCMGCENYLEYLDEEIREKVWQEFKR